MRPPSRFRAIRFIHPDFSEGEARVGLTTDLRGRLDSIDEKASVRQALLLLFSTAPGERVMRPDYGCNLMRLVYAPNDDTTAGLAIHYVRQAIDRFEPRVEILRLDAVREDPLAPRAEEGGGGKGGAGGSSEELHVLLEYRVKPTSETDALVYTMSRTGERR